MKTLTDHTIIYDEECPLCDLYTRTFLRTGMLDQHGREKFTAVEKCSKARVDWNRARNEIALINKKNGSVLYGVDSLMKILEYQWPLLKPLFANRIFHFLMQQFYFFISYNRKVIVPASVFEKQNTCTPDLNISYRWAYIIFCWIITSLILVSYSHLLVPVVPAGSYLREFTICGGQILFQGSIVALIRKEKFIHYIGNLMTIALAGALLLSIALLLTSVIHSLLFYAIYFMLVVCLMFFEHIRRVKVLELPFYLSAIWVIYRVLVLLIIL